MNICIDCEKELIESTLPPNRYWCCTCNSYKRNTKYIQYVYHFQKRDSIDIRTITEEDFMYCDDMLNYGSEVGTMKDTLKTIRKMLTEHFPERLI